MFKNFINKKNEEKLLDNNQNIKQMVTKCDLLINMSDISEVKEAIRVMRDEIRYLKLSTKSETKALERKICNNLDDLKICINKKEKALQHINELMKMIKERDILA